MTQLAQDLTFRTEFYKQVLKVFSHKCDDPFCLLVLWL